MKAVAWSMVRWPWPPCVAFGHAQRKVRREEERGCTPSYRGGNFLGQRGYKRVRELLVVETVEIG